MSIEQRQEVDELKKDGSPHTELANFLCGFDWTQWVTLTFGSSFEPTDASVWSKFSRWVRRLTQSAGRRIGYFAVREKGRHGRPHLHVLLAKTEDLSGSRITDAWSHGRAEAEQYDPSKKAAYYLAKFANDDDADFDLLVDDSMRLLGSNQPTSGE